MKEKKIITILSLSILLSLQGAFFSRADLILDSPCLSGSTVSADNLSQNTSAGETAPGGAAGNATGTSPLSANENNQSSQPAPVNQQEAQNTQAPQVSQSAAEEQQNTKPVGPVLADAPSLSGSGSSVSSIETAPQNVQSGPSSAAARINLPFSVAVPAHKKGGISCTRAAVQLSDGSWQNFSYDSNVRSPYYRVIREGVDGSGERCYIAAASAKKFGDTYTKDGNTKNEIYLKAADCTIVNYIDITPVSDKRAAAVKAAFALLGKAYRYGGNGPEEFDCSGLVKWVMEQAGVSVPRTSTELMTMSGQISESQLRPGDVLARNGHCGIYVGNDIFIHASDSGIGVVAEYLSVYNTGNRFTNYINVFGD